MDAAETISSSGFKWGIPQIVNQILCEVTYHRSVCMAPGPETNLICPETIQIFQCTWAYKNYICPNEGKKQPTICLPVPQGFTPSDPSSITKDTVSEKHSQPLQFLPKHSIRTLNKWEVGAREREVVGGAWKGAATEMPPQVGGPGRRPPWVMASISLLGVCRPNTAL